ncbi:major facilitator superfamily domain-containing protein [Mycena vulgaris]|nr:major facilitator superfamily domain-containing protein [Mycena vulgaris]
MPTVISRSGQVPASKYLLKSRGQERLPTAAPEEIAWDGPGDQVSPQNWTNRQKWMITLVCIVMTTVSHSPSASSAPNSATYAIMVAFDIKQEVSYLITSNFLLGYAFGHTRADLFFWPLVLGPGSELIGRRPIFVIAMSTYTLLHLGQALAQNIETLLIARFLGGSFAVAPLINAGNFARHRDIWSAETRGLAASMFSARVFLGPVMGHIVAGYIVESTLSWRWVFWVMMMLSGTCAFVMIAVLAGANSAQGQSSQRTTLFAAHEKQNWSPRGVVHHTLFCPFHILAGELILILVTLYLSLVYGVMPSPIIFIDKRGFTIAQNGLERLCGGMVGGCAFVIGILGLGWTCEYSRVPWYVPALSAILAGMSISMIFISFLSHFLDTYLMDSASAFSANTFCRSLVGATFPLCTVQMLYKLGVSWAATLLADVGFLLAPIPFLFYKHGARIHAGRKLAPCVDLEIAKIFAAGKADSEDKVSA